MIIKPVFIHAIGLLAVLALGLAACSPAPVVASATNALMQATSTTMPDNTPAAGATATLDPMAVRINGALSLLLSPEPTQTTLPSFHFVARNQSPAWFNGMSLLAEDQMNADVQGANVHYKEVKNFPGQASRVTEVYLVDGQEYDVVNGQVGTAVANSNAWLMWQVNPILMLITGEQGATPAGTETVEGRTAEVYALQGGISTLSGPTAGFPASIVSGKVWIDQQTGAMLKAEIGRASCRERV
jgi:hypothetical protein